MKKFCLAWLLLHLIDLRISSSETPVGVKLQITQTGLNYAANVVVDVLVRDILSKNIADQQGEQDKIKYELKNIKVDEFTRPDVGVVLYSESSTILLSLSNVRVKCSADWSYHYRQNRFIQLRDSGRLTATADGVSISVSVGFGLDSASGRPTLHTTQCVAHVNNLNLEFHGGTDWIYNMIKRFVTGPIEESLQDEMCRGAIKAINEKANQELSTLDVEARLGNGLFYDYKLTLAPQIRSDYIESSHAGVVFGDSAPREPLSSNLSQISKHPGQKMLSVLLSEGSLNSYGKALFISNQLSKVITRNDFPDQYKTALDTDCKSGTCFAKLISRTAKFIPNASIEINYAVIKAPTVTVKSHGASSNITARVRFYIPLSNGTIINLSTVELSTAFNLTLRSDGNLVKFSMDQYRSYIKLENPENTDAVEAGIRFAVGLAGAVIKTEVNKFGDMGIPVPTTKDVVFENSELTLEDGFLYLQSDVKYTS